MRMSYLRIHILLNLIEFKLKPLKNHGTHEREGGGEGNDNIWQSMDEGFKPDCDDDGSS